MLSGVTEWVYWVQSLKLPFLKEHKKNTLFGLAFFNFCPALEEYYHVSILLKMSIRVAKLNHNASFKDNYSSMAM